MTRRLLGISQHQLDKEAGLPKGTVHDLESGRTVKPSHETVVRIVRAMRRLGLHGVTGEDVFPVPETPRDAESREAVATK